MIYIPPSGVIYIRQNKISRKMAYSNFKRPQHNILGKTKVNKINCVKKNSKIIGVVARFSWPKFY